MDDAKFGMQERPFDSGIAQDVDVFLGPRQEAAVGRFKVAVASPDAVVTFSGPAGVGKTTLASVAMRATSTRLAMAWLNAAPTNATELLELLLVELGMNAHRTTRVERLQMWRQYLSEIRATESRVFVIAERTEELSPEVVRALDSLTATDANGCPGANVVLLGGPELERFLAAPGLESLRQRIRLRQRLEAFSPAELSEYLRHRVTRAGGDFDKVFATDAAGAVHRYSGGVARVANGLCETALAVAAADDRDQITAQIISEVAVDMLGIAEPADDTPAPANSSLKTKEAAATPVEAVAPPPAPAAVAARGPVAAPASVAAPPPAAATPVAPPASVAAPTRVVSPPPAEPVAANRAAATPPPAAVAAPPPVAGTPLTRPPVFASPPMPAPAPPTVRTPSAAPPVAKWSAPVTPPPAPPSFVAFEPAKPAKPAVPASQDFDATATDIPDVSQIDFPVLTDAIEPSPTPAPARVAAPAAKPAPAPAPAATRPTVTRPPAPAPKPAAPARPAASVAPPKPAVPPAPATPPKAAEPKRRAQNPAMAPPIDAETDADIDADVLRQTQTMRALSVAKSIDDVSDSMAETLFGDADLDALSAALASAGFNDGTDEGADEGPAPEPRRPTPASQPDDLMDLFNLGPDAPLELIDDSVNPPSDRTRKSATRR
jgi:type II secretory pathway predicted ATPase ExeA